MTEKSINWFRVTMSVPQPGGNIKAQLNIDKPTPDQAAQHAKAVIQKTRFPDIDQSVITVVSVESLGAQTLASKKFGF